MPENGVVPVIDAGQPIVRLDDRLSARLVQRWASTGVFAA
jgi:hypothetical protein